MSIRKKKEDRGKRREREEKHLPQRETRERRKTGGKVHWRMVLYIVQLKLNHKNFVTTVF